MRQKYALYGIILFAITCVYLIYRAFNTNVSALEWNILLWIVTLFASLNAVLKSFSQERSETFLYYYTLFDPLEVLLSKLIYNFIFVSLLIGICILAFTILINNPVKIYPLFFYGASLGALGISSVFTFVSSVSGTNSGNSTLMSILALPLVLPIMMLLIKITAVAMRLIGDSAVMKDVILIFGIDLFLIGIMLLIFPSLWRS